jgi:hypothetical protein
MQVPARYRCCIRYGISRQVFPHISAKFYSWRKNLLVQVPAGMSDYGWRRVSGEAPPTAETVETTKTGLVHFFGSGLLPEMEVAICL